MADDDSVSESDRGLDDDSVSESDRRLDDDSVSESDREIDDDSGSESDRGLDNGGVGESRGATESQASGEDSGADRSASTASDGGTVDRTESSVEYLDEEINLFKPATPFMRDNLKMIFTLFAVWLLFVFGPVTASYFWPEFMTETRVLGGYPLNFFLTALVAPAAALVLAALYAWYRDRLDEKYGISHAAGGEQSSGAPAADGGESE